jgi:NAD-dependent SIR2 family protein deacetylase
MFRQRAKVQPSLQPHPNSEREKNSREGTDLEDEARRKHTDSRSPSSNTETRTTVVLESAQNKGGEVAHETRVRQICSELEAASAKTQQTKEKVAAVLDSSPLKSLEQRWQEFQDAFDAMNRKMVENIARSLQRHAVHVDANANDDPKIPSLSQADIIHDIAQGIHTGMYKSVSMLTGAGVSVASGIPDFRSPGGMYDTLRPELLTANAKERKAMKLDPTTVVSWGLFQENPLPYLELRRPFILGVAKEEWKMTLAHYFQKALHDHAILNMVYTQNIDGLDQQAGIPQTKIINVHGTMAEAQCEFCATMEDQKTFVNKVKMNVRDIYGQNPGAPKKSTPILCSHCKKPGVKQRTVLYGRTLPPEFYESQKQDLPQTDLLIVAGTSLTVAPACDLPYNVGASTKRVLINREKAGQGMLDLRNRPGSRDYFLHGDCDDIFLKLLEALGWLSDIPLGKLCDNSKRLVVEHLKRRAMPRRTGGPDA